MNRILLLVCLAIVVITVIECASAKTVSDLDVESVEDLVADEVKEAKKASKSMI